MIAHNVEYEDGWAMADPMGGIGPLVPGLGQVGTGTGGQAGAGGTYGSTNPQKPSLATSLLALASTSADIYAKAHGVGPQYAPPPPPPKKKFPVGLALVGAGVVGFLMLRKRRK
jgi:hypothetical protein